MAFIVTGLALVDLMALLSQELWLLYGDLDCLQATFSAGLYFGTGTCDQ